MRLGIVTKFNGAGIYAKTTSKEVEKRSKREPYDYGCSSFINHCDTAEHLARLNGWDSDSASSKCEFAATDTGWVFIFTD